MNIKNLIISLVAALGLSVTSAVADGHKYTVDSSNYTTYTDMLSPGQLTMFSAYPDTYKIHVYETGADCKLFGPVATAEPPAPTVIGYVCAETESPPEAGEG